LFRTLAAVAPEADGAPPNELGRGLQTTPQQGEAGDGEGLIDEAEALNRVGGDRGLLKSLTEVFFDSYPAQLAQLREAIGRGDGPAVYRLAHTLVGAVGIFGARGAVEAAARLETMGREGRLVGAEEAWERLDAAFARLRPALEALTEEAAAPR
jgi:HPt (histidine-containing phosphotransfer) domain-containing protein